LQKILRIKKLYQVWGAIFESLSEYTEEALLLAGASSIRAHDVGAVGGTSGKAEASHREGVLPQGRDHPVTFGKFLLKLPDQMFQVLLLLHLFILSFPETRDVIRI